MSLFKSNIEIDILKYAIYYTLDKMEQNDFFTTRKCLKIMQNELYYIPSKGNVRRFFDNSIVQELENKICVMNPRLYDEYYNTVIMKLRNYNIGLEGSILYPTDEDVNDIANEIISYNKGFDELKDECNDNIYSKYALQFRYYDDTESYKICEELASYGYKRAIYQKAWHLYNGYGVKFDERKAFQELSELVENEKYTYTKALILLGRMYELGYSKDGIGSSDYNKARELYEKASVADPEAKYYLGLLYYRYGWFWSEEKEEKGMMLIKEAASENNKKAIKYLLRHLNNTELIIKTLSVDVKCIEEMVKQLDYMEIDVKSIEVLENDENGKLKIIFEDEEYKNRVFFDILKQPNNDYKVDFDIESTHENSKKELDRSSKELETLLNGLELIEEEELLKKIDILFNNK